jgi:hypothetical protein
MFEGCHDTHPLFVKNCEDIRRISIIAPSPWIEHSLRKDLHVRLPKNDYKIEIAITSESDAAVFSESEVLKEQKRLVAHVKVFDQNYKCVMDTSLDAYATHEVNDIAPFASLSEEFATTNLLLRKLAQDIKILIEGNLCN